MSFGVAPACLSLNMPAAAMQITVLVFAGALCTVSFSETEKPNTVQSTSASVASTNHANPSTSVNPTSTTVHQKTSATTTANVSFTSQTPLMSSTPTQPPKQTEETSPSPPAQTTTTNQTSSQAGSSRPSLQVTSGSANTSGDTTINPTSAGLSDESGKSNLEANPGLVAVICIFCIIFALVLVVALVKCTKSPRSNFERLEDVPLGKVSEDSPFAQHSK